MSNIGYAREQILQIAQELREAGGIRTADRLENIVHRHMYRRSAARRMPIHSDRVTADVRRAVLELARTTQLHSAEIAVQLNLNPGRVSEILQGDR